MARAKFLGILGTAYIFRLLATSGGVSYPGARYAFVFPDVSADEKRTTAHELGHAIASFPDLNSPGSSDQNNLMWIGSGTWGTRLRYGQWAQIQQLK